jgi:hypothetical protein
VLDFTSVLERAIASPTTTSPEEVVRALLAAETEAKKNKLHYSFERLIGSWRLCFITGTKKTRQKAGIVLGAGRYLPQFLKIQITYSSSSEPDRGTVENSVSLVGIKLTLTGPIKFLTPKNILVFDFTRIQIQFWGVKIYEGYIRGGETKEAEFFPTSVSKQAFFSYFSIADRLIAARGKGGGLALWSKVDV